MNTMDYTINGDFGQVRLCRSILAPQLHTPFSFLSGGWHHCNDLYYHKRPNGQNFYMLFFSVTSGGCIHIQDHIYNLPTNSITIVPPNLSHEYYTLSGEWWEFYWLNIPLELNQLFDKIVSDFGYVIETSRMTQMRNLIENLFPERFLYDEISYEITASKILSQIFHIILEDIYHNTDNHQKKNPIVLEAIHKIESSYRNKLNIEKLADSHFISVQHLIRIFKEDTGYTPYEYLKKYRLQKARELLVSSNFSIGEVAEEVGFSNGNNFIYQFKKEYGITPGEYREMYL